MLSSRGRKETAPPSFIYKHVCELIEVDERAKFLMNAHHKQLQKLHFS